MAANKTVWGIDLGRCALKAIGLRLDGDKVEAVDHAYIEHPKILSQPDVDRDKLIAQAMQQFVEKHDLSNATIVVGVPGQQTLARFSKLPPVEKKKIVQIVAYEAQQQIPFDMDEVIWDYQIFEDADGIDTEVGIFAMRREILHSHLRPVTELNLEPAAVQSAPLALYNALRYDGPIGEEAVVIVDIGTENTDLIVADGDSLWTRNIPIGGNNFTEALTKTFKLSFNKAERLKREAQKHKYARQIFQAMRPVFADLAAEIQRSIGFFTSARRGVKLRKILAMGSAFQLPGMVKFIQQNLGMEVVRVTTFSRLQTKNAMNAPELTQQLQSFGVAYGLALQGLGQASLVSSLLPPEIAKQIIWRKKSPWFYGAAACLMFGAILVWARQMSDLGVVNAANPEGAQTNFIFPTETATIGEKEIPRPNPQALSIMQSGLGDLDSPAEKLAAGKKVAAVAQHLNSVYGTIDSEISAVSSKADSLAKLQTHKTVWLKLVHMIHGAIPRPDPKLAEAMSKGHDAYLQLIKSDSEFERQNRREIYIENFEVMYSQDTLATIDELTGVVADATGAGGGGTGMGKEGFVVRIVGRSTHMSGARFLEDTLVKNLKSATEPGKRVDGVSMHLDKIKIVDARKISELSGESGLGGRAPAGTGNYGTGGAGGAMMSARSELDPVTGEPMLNDYRFEIIFAAVLMEKPQDPTAGF